MPVSDIDVGLICFQSFPVISLVHLLLDNDISALDLFPAQLFDFRDR